MCGASCPCALMNKTSRLTAVGGSPALSVRAEPASEYWLAFIDDDGLHYRESPAEFGIELRHIEPGAA